MPVAMPTWRKVLLAPEAMPLRWGCTTETAPEARTGLTIPTPKPLDQEPRQQHGPGRVRMRRRHQQQPAAHHEHADAQEQARLHAHGEAPCEEGGEEDEERHRQEADTGGQRAVAQVVLDVEGQVEEHGEDGSGQAEGRRRQPDEGGDLEEAEVQHRVARVALVDEEGHHEDGCADEQADGLAAAPAEVVAAHEREHQQEEARPRR